MDPDFWRTGCLLIAVIILPLGCFFVFRALKRAVVPSPPRLEFFTAFGTFGGWLLTAALSPSPLGILCAMFLVFVAVPTTLFLLVRLSWRPRPSRFHRNAFFALAAGLGVPALITFMAIQWSSAP